MRDAYSSTWSPSLMAASVLLSASVLSGCAGTGAVSMHANDNAPSLRAVRPWRIVQVAANRYPEIRRDAPYYILCSEDTCPDVTPKTPVAALVPGQVSAREARVPSHSVDKGGEARQVQRSVLKRYRVFFDYASATLDAPARQTLDRFIDEYRARFPRLVVTGYTDSVRVADGSVSNRWLALQRAVAVKRQLIASGFPEDQVSLEAKFLCCYIDSNESPSGRRHNRRAELSIIVNP